MADDPFSPWRSLTADDDEGERSPLPHPLGQMDSLYRAMGAIGWGPVEVDGMFLWQCASFLGVDGRDPVIRGGRALVLPSDDSGGGGSGPTISDERVAEAKRRFDERARAQHEAHLAEEGGG